MELEKAMGHANVKMVMKVPTVIIVQIIILSYRKIIPLLVKNAINLVKIVVKLLGLKVSLYIKYHIYMYI